MSTDKRIKELERQVADLRAQNQDLFDRMGDQEHNFTALETLVLGLIKTLRHHFPC